MNRVLPTPQPLRAPGAGGFVPARLRSLPARHQAAARPPSAQAKVSQPVRARMGQASVTSRRLSVFTSRRG
jgi:hypothetical protein